MRSIFSSSLVAALTALLLVTPVVRGQDPPSTSDSDVESTTTSSFPISVSRTTGSITLAVPTTVSGRATEITTVVPNVFNVTYTLTPSATSSQEPSSTADPSASASASETPEPIVLDTRLDPAFGVLGAILILTGLPSAFWGHKNRWTSFFLIGFYTLSLVCIVLILKFGVLPAINPPSKTVRGMFVLACTIAGVAGGAIAIFFWKGARYGIGAWGGFALALWIQCFNNGGLIKPIGFRWILYIGCGVAGFALCTIPKIHYHVLLVSTAFVGATSFMLGVDCFTTAGLKEFYIWNLGFPALFPKFIKNKIQFPVTQQMQIELGLTGAVALMGMAVQFRILKVLQRKLAEIAAEERKRDEEAEMEASKRFDDVKREQMQWEREHPTLPKHGRQDSAHSGVPLMREKDREGSSTPTTNDRLSTYMEGGQRQRALSGLSDFKVAPTNEEELRRASRYMQNPGVLPTLDLGLGIQEDVPANFIASKSGDVPITSFKASDVATVVANEMAKSKSELEDLRKKEELLAEIQNIRKSIDVLKSETPLSTADPSRRPSLSSRRTLSVDANHALVPSGSLQFTHTRPPRATDPHSGSRARSHSMEFSALTSRLGGFGLPDPISRPTSVPLQDPDWDNYIQERKLLQPPSGVTPPIPTTPLPTPRGPLPAAVQDALTKRKQRESTVLYAGQAGSGSGRESDGAGSSADDLPLSKIAGPKPRSNLPIPPQLQSHNRQSSTGSHAPPPVTILPPRRASATIAAPAPQHHSPSPIVKTFEELNERHREKMRDIQAPLTRAEREQIELAAAKQRWERNKAIEKEAMEKREKEQREKQKRRQSDDAKLRSAGDSRRRHSRSMSGDRLGMGGHHESSSRRLSTMKVEDWQRYQQEVAKSNDVAPLGKGLGPIAPSAPSPSGMRRTSRSLSASLQAGIPFPADGRIKARDPVS
ncbi:hypothetical protein CC1G_01707 [Coprinopsis cinerea okayama7|uniref:TM7S3/TM198-like domain-containing protein n=1 Tax=Coprinopsis cinerea (strain Okayama-7 / 130 / ATCC MYA-4618 / FGSC 9003) TaxID=240176 RepID=A8N2J0_COPC7|nr:hypothetical protein CC1G_01707 [Coprinopsis cinerea okayama7\|eukprot:XP_001829027.1 hypothetical protein CC1G_01707 [Coprinopsis cinerea okayama7\